MPVDWEGLLLAVSECASWASRGLFCSFTATGLDHCRRACEGWESGQPSRSVYCVKDGTVLRRRILTVEPYPTRRAFRSQLQRNFCQFCMCALPTML